MTYLLSFVTKRRSTFGYESSHVPRERVSIGDFLLGGVFLFMRDVVRIFFFFFFLYFLFFSFSFRYIIFLHQSCDHLVIANLVFI